MVTVGLCGHGAGARQQTVVSRVTQVAAWALTCACGLCWRVLQVLVYFAVAKLGEKPTDGKTDVNPEGLTAGAGLLHNRLWLHPVPACVLEACGMLSGWSLAKQTETGVAASPALHQTRSMVCAVCSLLLKPLFAVLVRRLLRMCSVRAPCGGCCCAAGGWRPELQGAGAARLHARNAGEAGVDQVSGSECYNVSIIQQAIK